MNENGAAFERLVRDHLRGLHLHLQIVHAGVVVAVAALRHQSAERDEEIARVLEYFVGDRLADQIERTAELIASLHPLPMDPADIDSWDPRQVTTGDVREAVQSRQLEYVTAIEVHSRHSRMRSVRCRHSGEEGRIRSQRGKVRRAATPFS